MFEIGTIVTLEHKLFNVQSGTLGLILEVLSMIDHNKEILYNYKILVNGQILTCARRAIVDKVDI